MFNFDPIASTYDRLNHIMSFNLDKSWRRRAARRLSSDTPIRLLDIAAGTGDMTLAVAEHAKEGSLYANVDISQPMLDIARDKYEDAGLQVDISVASADRLPYSDSSFDRCVSAFGVRNFANLDRCLAEMYRVLEPGGRLVVLELSTPDNPFLLWCYRLYACHFLPWLGSLIAHNRQAYTYLPQSILRFPKGRQFMQRLHQAGFGKVSQRKMTFGACRMYCCEK